MDNSLVLLSEATGEQLNSMELPEKCSAEYSGAILGTSLLQPTEHGVSLINTETMTVKFSRSFGGTAASDCAVIDDMGFFAIKYDDSYDFMCIDLSSPELPTLWEYELEEQPTAAALQGENVIFAAGSTLITHNIKNNSFIEIPLEKDVSGDPFATEYAVFFNTKDGYAGKLRLNTDGTLEEDTLTFCKIGASPSSPVSWNGRLYTATNDGFYIVDNLNMEVTYIISEIKGGCTPQIHYGSGPYIYTVAKREDRWAIYSILDMEEKSEPTVKIIALMDQYNSGSFCASAKGSLYFRDDIGRVYALTAVPFDVFGLIIRLVVLLALLVLVFFWLRKVAKRRENLRPRY